MQPQIGRCLMSQQGKIQFSQQITAFLVIPVGMRMVPAINIQQIQCCTVVASTAFSTNRQQHKLWLRHIDQILQALERGLKITIQF